MLPYYCLLAGLRSLYVPLLLLSILRIYLILVRICLSRTVRHIESRKRRSIEYADFIPKDPSMPLNTPVSATSVYDTRTKAQQLSSEYPSSKSHPDTP
jgi:hypothetical protein